MTPRPPWHPEQDVLQTYADTTAGPVLAASVEAHVLTCGHCRTALAGAVTPARLAGLRQGIDDRIDAAERPWEERLLRRVGVGEADARVLLAAPSTRAAWWLAVALALLLAVLAAVQDPDRSAALLLLAPLLPVVATAASYAPRLDPAFPLTAATPYPARRRLLLRSGAVAGASTALMATATAALPVSRGQALVWLLPAAALTAAVLALSTWVDAELAAAACCAGWAAAVWTAHRPDLEPLAIYDGQGQLACGVLLVAAVAVLVRQRHRIDPGSPT